ncbi:hypothetical protein [Mucilaginibacter sp.]|jgi:hypothetical protein|uniref:hypothetical protein n=1 Tax=Mucilaginibacter sp. TaxID=1882438 RepID=UPI0035682BBC
MKKIITNGTHFITSRFGKVQLTDNINIANVYQVNEQSEDLLNAMSVAVDTALQFEDLNKFYTPINF